MSSTRLQACRLCNQTFYSHLPQYVCPDLCFDCHETPPAILSALPDSSGAAPADQALLRRTIATNDEDEGDEYVYPSSPGVYKSKASGPFTKSIEPGPFQYPGRNTLAASDLLLGKPVSSRERTENPDDVIYSYDEVVEDEDDEELDFDSCVEVAFAKLGIAMPRDSDEPFKLNEEGLLKAERLTQAAIDKENEEWRECRINREKQDEDMSEQRAKVFEAILDGLRSGEITATLVDSIEIDC